MNPKPAWRRLYIFIALGLVCLFLLPPTDKFALILWVFLMYGGIAIWLKGHTLYMAEQPAKTMFDALSPAEEYPDEDQTLPQSQSCPSPGENTSKAV